MKLFLSSLALSDKLTPEFVCLVGKPEKDITVAYVQNAADPYPEGKRAWVEEERITMQSHRFTVELIDLEAYRNKLPELKTRLSGKDVIWFGGGNIYYIRWLLEDTGIDKLVVELIKQGVIYAGCSAGAIIAGPTLKHFETADDPDDAPEVILGGLHLTGTVVVPHMDNQKYASVIHGINANLNNNGYKTVPLNDAQALVVDGKEQRIV